MDFHNNQFDVVVASLILTVVPNPEQCLKEMLRVLVPGGKLIIFDKFVPKEGELSLLKKGFRPLIKWMGTDIGLSFESLYQKQSSHLSIIEDTPVLMRGMYRKIILEKCEDVAEKG